eukprot:TRINITY_DN6848_c0_g1_i4.p1 TRINITY_DN6848_c0_g1~~TRINITY_DN6848_c0_g1_i4.p1  ORF type:complete len:390 (-),score=78.24 TRINITY_DN6848_c0_g1_i4:261-1430(-)
MGNAPSTAAEGEDQYQGKFIDNLWMVGCRPFDNECTTFTDNTFLFQPDTRFLSNSFEYKHDRDSAYCVEKTVTANMVNVDTVTNSVSKRANEPFPSNSTVLVYVHGFRQTYEKVYRTIDHLWNRSQDSVTVVGFLWPCHIKHVSYSKAREKTVQASKRLRRALQYILAKGNTVHVFAHSLGTRVALGALLDSGLFQYGEGEMGDLFLAAAAVPSDCLGEKAEFPAHRVAAQSITVFHSLKDDVLRQALPVVEGLPGLMAGRPRAETKALGYKGPTGDVHSKVKVVDCSATVYMHRIHVYIASPECHGPILESCGLGHHVCFDGQSTSVLNEGPFSPSTHHDEFARQTSKVLFSPDMGGFRVEEEQPTPEPDILVDVSGDSDDECANVVL